VGGNSKFAPHPGSHCCAMLAVPPHRKRGEGKDAQRDCCVIASASEAIQAGVPIWIASSLALLAMTMALRRVARRMKRRYA
jgi:hypothetical protein